MTITYDKEIPSSIPAPKMFKVFVLNGDTIIPKSCHMPYIKSVETLEGDGGVGTINLWRSAGNQHKCMKHRVDAIDKENFMFSYSIIEGSALMEIFESISYNIKIISAPDGGSICKNRNSTKGDTQVSEEEIKICKEKVSSIFKAVEVYFLANLDA